MDLDLESECKSYSQYNVEEMKIEIADIAVVVDVGGKERGGHYFVQ